MVAATVNFVPLKDNEREALLKALRGNGDGDGAILMDRCNTSFLGAADEVTDEEVINCIKSVPCQSSTASRVCPATTESSESPRCSGPGEETCRGHIFC